MVVIAGILLAWLALAYGWQSFWGGRGVEELCAKDGGLQIQRSVVARGILSDMPWHSDGCLDCVEYLTRFDLDFMDINVRTPSFGRGDVLFPDIGYYRMSISIEGDPRCDPWLRAPEAQHMREARSRFGLQPSQCVVIQKLPKRPSGVVLDEVNEALPVTGGQQVYLQELRVRVEATGETLGRWRNYTYKSKWQKYLDESGGGGTVQYSCTQLRPDMAITEFELVGRVLQSGSADPKQNGVH